MVIRVVIVISMIMFWFEIGFLLRLNCIFVKGLVLVFLGLNISSFKLIMVRCILSEMISNISMFECVSG